ncbi:MAG: hypothetical protein M1819_000181 [Sarea resinae]|nr:MAG: hypothetical protein M1819_000181 [Sarea resinae]
MLSPEVREPTVLEEYFCRTIGITYITLGILTILLTGSVPLTSSFSDSATAATTTDPQDPKAPYALPTLTITTLYHAALGFYTYMLYTGNAQTCFALACAGFSALAAMGLWCILFASSGGRISRKTGVDKRTSGWPFKNAEAEKRKGKEL